MTHPNILTHLVEATLVAYDDGHLLKGVLITAPDRDAIAARLIVDGAQLVEQGALTLRLGVALYDRPFVFVPHSIISEMGAIVEGEVLFDWLRAKAYDQPRSEVFGVNARGADDQVFAREIDLQESPIVVGGSEDAQVYVALCIGQVELPPRFAARLRVLAAANIADVRRTLATA